MREALILAAALAQITTIQTTEQLTVSDEPVLFESIDRNEYLLGAGDMLQVTVAGGCTQMMLASGVQAQSICIVSGDGNLSVSGLGTVAVNGTTIAEAEEAIIALARRYYPRISLGIALVEPRMMKVYAGGMVESPGTYTISAISRVSDLVTLAGGLTSYSSRRGSMYTDRGDTVSIDLRLDPGTHARMADPFLSDNASVIFGLCNDPVYILRGGGLPVLHGENEVSSVETWDVDPGTSLEVFLEQIGGLGGDMDLERSVLMHDGSEYPLWSGPGGLTDITVQSGDTLSLVMLTDSVFVGGAVNYAGRLSYRPGYSAREYVNMSGGFRYNSGIGGTTVYRNGREVAKGSDALDMILLPGDVVEVPWAWIAVNAEWIRIIGTLVTIVVAVDGLTD